MPEFRLPHWLCSCLWYLWHSDGDEDEETLYPIYIDDESAFRFFWNENRYFQDEEGKPLKEITLRIEALDYDDPITVNIKYRKRNSKKTIKFKPKKK